MDLRNILKTLLVVLFAGALLAAGVHARPTSVKNSLIRMENPDQGKQLRLILPYAFSTESMGTTFGVGGGVNGYGQEQLLLGATVFGSVDEAVGLFVGMWDFRPSFANRLFFSVLGMVGHYPEQRVYSDLSFKPDGKRPGSNDSDENQYAEDSGYDNWTDIRIEYVLPIGSARDDALQHYEIKKGLLQSNPVGGPTWNPLENGVTTLLFRQYNTYRSFEFDAGDIDATEHPLQLAICYNNTDFPTNPSTGSTQFIGITHDFGWLDSPDDWTFIEFEACKYFSLGDSDWARQRIIALNLWTGYSPSWDEETDADGNVVVSHRPPFYDGATLGGFYRMRGYPADRFNDRAVIYTAAEYRYTLDWNPIGDISWLGFLQSDWLQLVGFVEGGRVANKYSDLFQDWKVDCGVGLRAMFAGAVIRMDVGASDESTSVWVMVGHPF